MAYDSPRDVGKALDDSLARLEREVKTAVRAVNRDAGNAARREHRATAAQSAGGDRTFSNFRKAGRLDVKVRSTPTGATVIPTGPWKIAEEGADPHGNHPGTRASQGRRSWSRAEKATTDALDRSTVRTLNEAGDRGFRA